MNQYLFIDGNYLRCNFERQMKAFYGLAPAVNFVALAGENGGQRVYYYDAIDYQRAEKNP